MDVEAYTSNITRALQFVTDHDNLLTLGVTPSRPEPGYGYIQMGEPAQEEDLFSIKSFTEKPEREFARIFMESGEFVMRCNFGWADMGTWHSIYEAMSKGEGDNVVLDSEVMMEDCRNNVIKLPKGKLGVFYGLEGFIVAERDNVLMICKKEDSSALVRKYVNEVQRKYGDEFV